MKIYHQSSFLPWPFENESIQAIITSPPFYSLRKYDIIIGGNPECEHEWGKINITLKHKAGETNPGKESWFKDSGASEDKGNVRNVPHGKVNMASSPPISFISNIPVYGLKRHGEC